MAQRDGRHGDCVHPLPVHETRTAQDSALGPVAAQDDDWCDHTIWTLPSSGKQKLDGGVEDVEDLVSDIHVDNMANLVIIDGANDVSKDESDQGSDSGLEVDAEEVDTMVRRARKLGCSCEEVANAENFNDIGLEQKQELLLRLWPQTRNYSE